MASECDSPSALAGSPHQRRKFDAAYKLRIVREAECGGVGQVLQREGLSSACLCLWRKQRAAGELAGLSPGRRGRPSNGGTLEFARMKRENQSLRKRLKMAETTIEVQRKVCQTPENSTESERSRKQRLISAISELSLTVGTAAACAAVGVPRATYYRHRLPLPAAVLRSTAEAMTAMAAPAEPASANVTPAEVPAAKVAARPIGGAAGEAGRSPRQRAPHPRALSDDECTKVLDALNSARFQDKSPQEVHATLLDEGVYYCSRRTMYRILARSGEVKERRNQLKHPQYKKPELLATAPNQVWSWDITKLLGPEKWTYFYLYVIIDIFSRYVVGWMVASRECASLATDLIRETCRKQNLDEHQLKCLKVHSDRGAPMKAKLLVQLYADLGVTKSFSRPHVSNDNPFSESHFKTLKYQPAFPGRFGCQEDAVAFCRDFFAWYNNDHKHSGIALLTPEALHYGLAEDILTKRLQVLEAAFAAHPERFVRGKPQVPPPPREVWINPPKSAGDDPSAGQAVNGAVTVLAGPRPDTHCQGVITLGDNTLAMEGGPTV